MSFAKMTSANVPLKSTSARRISTITCATPSPAWPGRAVAPDTVKKTDGPKVRLLVPRKVGLALHCYPMFPSVNASSRATQTLLALLLTYEWYRLLVTEILPPGIDGLHRYPDAGYCRGASGQVCCHSSGCRVEYRFVVRADS